MIYNEIFITDDQTLSSNFNKLEPAERVFVYYLYRACQIGNNILADQQHRDNLKIIKLFDAIINNHTVRTEHSEFHEDSKIYFVYLLVNNGIYFRSESSNEKRTPHKLNLKHLTRDNLTKITSLMNYEDVTTLHRVIFDDTYEPTCTVPGSINESGVNIYSEDFTNIDYKKLLIKDQTKINAYFYKENETPKMLSYSVKYKKESEFANYWLLKAYEHAKKYPKLFDEHLVKSLELLMKFLETGDEKLFRDHSIEWLQITSRIQYTFGFIETYIDPMGYRGSFTAEIMIATSNMKEITDLILQIQPQLPFPEEFKRDLSVKRPILNASVNLQIFGSGDAGVLRKTAAYCLPNYEDIRAEIGSKQIIYRSSGSLGDLLNKKLNDKLFKLNDDYTWSQKYDPDNKLHDDIWNLQCILHETIGHASGKFGKDVTQNNYAELMKGYSNTIEELRAEIIAIYISITYLNELIKVGFLKEWTTLLTQEELIQKLILDGARAGFRRLIQQNDDAKEISEAHALADATILYYLVFNGGIEIVEEDHKEYQVVGLKMKDSKKAIELIKELMILVQTIKSTADYEEADKLISKYGKPIHDREHFRILKENSRKVTGNVKEKVVLFPGYKLNKEKTDCELILIKDIFEYYEIEKRLLKKSYRLKSSS